MKKKEEKNCCFKSFFKDIYCRQTHYYYYTDRWISLLTVKSAKKKEMKLQYLYCISYIELILILLLKNMEGWYFLENCSHCKTIQIFWTATQEKKNNKKNKNNVT